MCLLGVMNAVPARLSVAKHTWFALLGAAIAAIALVALLAWRMDLATRAERAADAAAARAATASDAALRAIVALEAENEEARAAQIVRLETVAAQDAALIGPLLALQNAVTVSDAGVAAARLAAAAHARAAMFESAGDDLDRRGDMLVWALAPALAASILIAIGLLASDWRKIQNRAASLDAAQSRAQQAVAAKSLMLAAASHDVRQPLHALSLLLTALKRRVADDEQRNIVDKMEQAAGALRRLFSSLLDVARLEAGVVRAEPHAFALEPMLAQLVEETNEVAGDGRVTLGPTPLWFYSDAQLFEAVIRNLLSNAIKVSARGDVRVECREEDGAVLVEVHDSGGDLSPEALDAILRGAGDPSIRVGLGLFIVREMAAILGLSVAARAAPEGGTVVTVKGKAAAPVDSQTPGLVSSAG